jgi:hypothetical protein
MSLLLYRLRNGRLHRPSPQQMQAPMRIIARWEIHSVMRAAGFGSCVRGGGDEETNREHVLQFPAGDGSCRADLGEVEGFVHHVAAPEGDDFSGLGEAIAGALDADVAPHHAAQGAFHIRDIEFGFVGWGNAMLKLLGESDLIFLGFDGGIRTGSCSEDHSFQQ